MHMSTEVTWCHIFHCESINRLSERSVSSKQELCCLLSEDICIPLRNTNYFTPAFVFQANLGPLPVQLAFRNPAPTSIVAQACLFILAGGEHTAELRKSTDPHGSRLLLSRNTMQDRGDGGATLPKTAQRQYKLAQIWSHSEFISAPTLHSGWPHHIKTWRKGLRATERTNHSKVL